MEDFSTSHVPLCVDLDGTLIRTDLLLESTQAPLKQNPLHLFVPPFWLLGRSRTTQTPYSRAYADRHRIAAMGFACDGDAQSRTPAAASQCQHLHRAQLTRLSDQPQGNISIQHKPGTLLT